MIFLYNLLLLILFSSTAFAVDIPFDTDEYAITGDAIYTWQSPSPYPTEGRDLIVRADPGYMVQITVNNVDINGAAGDFLLIKSGSVLDDDKTGRIFTHHLRSERTFLSLTSDVFFHFVVMGLNEGNQSGFSVNIQQFGDPPPTTTPPEVDTWPTPGDTHSIYFMPSISGRHPEDFTNNTNDFQEAVAAMAVEYCSVNNIDVVEAITKDNVRIAFIMRCPISWRDRDGCARIQFSLPVFLEEQTNHYELTTENLEMMWATLSDKYLAEIGLANYVPDDTDHMILIWLVTICLAILLFGVILYVTKLIAYNRIKATAKPKGIATAKKDNNPRLSSDSLGPHPFQSVPNLFESEFRLYEPELTATAAPRYASGVSEADLDMQQFTFPNEEHNKSSEI